MATTKKGTTSTKTAEVTVRYLVLTGKQPVKAYRTDTARDLYWQAFQAANGKVWAEVAKDLEASPPKLPKSGKVEKASGWLSYFEHAGLVKLEDRKVAAK